MKTDIKEPLISIIVNCFNGETFLEESIKSIILQTHKNWEIIFWDNKSIDNSKNIFLKFKDKRFRYFYADTHTTLYEARNLALIKARGEFVTFLDCDDLWTKDKLFSQLKKFEDKNIGMVYSNLWLLNNKSGKKKLFIKNKLSSGYIYDDLIKKYNIGIITVMIKMNCLNKIKDKFNPIYSVIGDFDFFLRFSKKFKINYINEPLAFYRLHGKNYSSINKYKEVIELEQWLDENKDKIEEDHRKNVILRINERKFLNAKLNKSFIECIKVLKNLEFFKLNFRVFAILLMPKKLLKLLLWY